MASLLYAFYFRSQAAQPGVREQNSGRNSKMTNHSTSVSNSVGGLLSKVSLLLSLSMGVTALGCYVGAGITSLAAVIVLGLLFFFGSFGVMLASKAGPVPGTIALALWTFVTGLFLGPTMNMYVQELGWQTVFLSFIGTGGVMAACGAVGAFSGRDFSGMGKWLTIGLLVLILVGVVNIFVGFSSGVTIIYCLAGMAIFAGYFIYDFFRMSQSENTWENAFICTIQSYLNFINFLLYLLRLILEAKKK